MASTSETGFAKQLANFEDFTINISKLGIVYSPPKPELNLANLQEQLGAAKDAMREISTALPPYSAAVDRQTEAFKFLNDKITKSLTYYTVCVSNPGEINTAKNLADKIRGKFGRKKATIAVDAPAKKTISLSQMSYDSRIENFKQYIDVITASRLYQNPGNGINIDDLKLLLSQMETTNNLVAEVKTPLDVARKKRAHIFYASVTGIGDLILNTKRYIKATLPKENPYYNPLLSISFKKR